MARGSGRAEARNGMSAATRFVRKLVYGSLTGLLVGVPIGALIGAASGTMIPQIRDLAYRIPICADVGDRVAADLTEQIGQSVGYAAATGLAGIFAGAVLGPLIFAFRNIMYSDLVE